ncbi:MAG: MBL fold metallo-hydrolase [Burkholderiaceae bacterium]|nr:MBL fold metallo-hydrolase [Burkholderiaceae bacterium]
MQIQFLGAADCVTGSKHLVQCNGTRVLLDCGMFQGWKTLRQRNWAPLSVPSHEIDAVILSHAHLDHSGWLPALVRQGFRGPIWCSPATRDLAEVILLDAAKLQEEDARRANRGGWSRHTPALPLYTVRDAQRALAQFRPVGTGRAFAPVSGWEARLTPVGHLLGACAVSLSEGQHQVVFSGDLGRADDLLMPAPQAVPTPADLLLVESTYGDRLHPPDDAQQRLGEIIRRTQRRGGSVLIPTFAVGRAQALLLVLQRLRRAGEIAADLPIYLDSPMAQEATAIYHAHRGLLALSAAEERTLCEGVRLVSTPAESLKLSRHRGPAVILSSSGMATGGRVLLHLAALAPNPRNAVVFPGYQVPGSRGGKLVTGAREVKIQGQYVAVKAEVTHLESFSSHADANGILDWLRTLPQAPRQVMVVHGDPAAADCLRTRIEDELGWPARVPQPGEVLPLKDLPAR